MTFTGENTLTGVTLTATGQAVTVGDNEDDSLRIGGNSKLTIGTLNGTIDLKTGTLTASSITNGSNGAFNVEEGNTVTFSGTNTFTNTAISNSGAITVDKDSLLTAANIANTGDGKVWIDATGFSGMKKIIDLSTAGDQDAKIVLKPGTSAGMTLTFDGEDYWITNASDSVITVDTSWAGNQYGNEVAVGKYYGYNAFSSFKDALSLNVADEIVLKDGGETVEVSGDIMLDVTKSVTVSGSGTVKFKVTPEGSTNDLCLSARGTNTEITIGDGVVLDTTESTARGNVWLDYYTKGGTINLNGSIKGKDQIWLGGNINIGTKGTLDAGGQICFRSGYNGETAKVTVTGSENSASNVQIKATTNLEFTSGEVKTNTTYIQGNKFVISDNHVNSDRALSVDSKNTTWDVSGALTSGTSGYKDEITLKQDSTLKVGDPH